MEEALLCVPIHLEIGRSGLLLFFNMIIGF